MESRSSRGVGKGEEIGAGGKRKKREEIKAKALIKKRPIDPFDLLDIPDRSVSGFVVGKPATEKQIELLNSYGVKVKEIEFGKASQLIEQLKARKEDGVCTYKQAQQLAKFGFETSMKFEDAKDVLDRLFSGGGKPWKNFTPLKKFRIIVCSTKLAGKLSYPLTSFEKISGKISYPLFLTLR